MEAFFLCFIPFFVAIDPFGILPLFMGLTEGFSSSERRRLAGQAALTAVILSLVFAVAGSYIFQFLGITPADFQIAGGLLLVIISIHEIFGSTARAMEPGKRDGLIGVVPMGVPLIAGPALITTLLIQLEFFPFLLIVSALILNLLITYVLLFFGENITHAIGDAPSRVFAKVVGIFLSAIGIMMIRRGVIDFLNSLPK